MAVLEITIDEKFSTSLLRVRPKAKMIELAGEKAKAKFVESNIKEIGFSICKYNVDFDCVGYGFDFDTSHAVGDSIFQIEWNDENSGFDVIIKGTFRQQLPDGFHEEFKEDGNKAAIFLTGLTYREGVVRGFVSDIIGYDSDNVSTAIKVKNFHFT